MYVLGIDTATMVCSIGLVNEQRSVAEMTLHTRKTHSERLLPMVQQLVADADLTPRDLSGVAVSIGPGSFTGLRIGITTAKSLAFALQIPVVGVPTLDALAAQFSYSRHLVCPVIDAQKGNVYTTLYRVEGVYPQRINEYRVMNMEELLGYLQTRGESVVLTGETELYAAQLGEMPEIPLLHWAPALQSMPRGAVIAALGLRKLQQGQTEDPGVLAPLYIRRSEAEVLWEQRHGGGTHEGNSL